MYMVKIKYQLFYSQNKDSNFLAVIIMLTLLKLTLL